MKKEQDALKFKINNLRGVGPARAKQLARLNIETIFDLLYYLPRDYLDRKTVTKIAEINQTTKEVTILGEIQAAQKIRTKQGRTIAKVAIADDTGIAYATWFQYLNTIDKFKQGDQVLFSGKINAKTFEQWKRVEFNHPSFEIIGKDNKLNSGRIVPVYGLTEGLPQKLLRKLVYGALRDYSYAIREFLPANIIDKYNLMNRSQAINNIHFPTDMQKKEEAYRRLAFEELFLFQFKVAKVKANRNKSKGYIFNKEARLVDKFITNLPFTLTGSQKKVWREIKFDMEKGQPMNRLLQGDVGAGKTVLALLVLLKALENGFQGAFMAPTEILAEQHYYSIKKFLTGLGVMPVLYTGSLPSKEKEEILVALAAGKINLVIGTHALIQKNVKFKNLGAAVIDEQHRFGVEQRKLLGDKGDNPHLLIMTATPIPRSLAFSLYGDLDYSALDELPPGRKAVATFWRKEKSREKIYKFLEGEIDKGGQVFVVCPLITESEKLQAEAAEDMYEKLKIRFSNRRVGLIHGQLESENREKVMEEFRSNRINILVATTVIEVGVDIPNATVMLIEDAQRFGLAQLHQLRGRVGRGVNQSYCILISEATDDIAVKRLKAMENIRDGFLLAEEDLKIRGAGDFFGTRQHGFSSFKVANLAYNLKLISLAHTEAYQYFINSDAREASFHLLEKESEERFPGDIII